MIELLYRYTKPESLSVILPTGDTFWHLIFKFTKIHPNRLKNLKFCLEQQVEAKPNDVLLIYSNNQNNTPLDDAILSPSDGATLCLLKTIIKKFPTSVDQVQLYLSNLFKTPFPKPQCIQYLLKLGGNIQLIQQADLDNFLKKLSNDCNQSDLEVILDLLMKDRHLHYKKDYIDIYSGQTKQTILKKIAPHFSDDDWKLFSNSISLFEKEKSYGLEIVYNYSFDAIQIILKANPTKISLDLWKGHLFDQLISSDHPLLAFLIGHGLSVNQAICNVTRVLRIDQIAFFCQNQTILNAIPTVNKDPNLFGCVPAHYAAFKGNVNAFIKFFSFEDISKEDMLGFTPFQYALMHANLEKRSQMAQHVVRIAQLFCEELFNLSLQLPVLINPVISLIGEYIGYPVAQGQRRGFLSDEQLTDIASCSLLAKWAEAVGQKHKMFLGTEVRHNIQKFKQAIDKREFSLMMEHLQRALGHYGFITLSTQNSEINDLVSSFSYQKSTQHQNLIKALISKEEEMSLPASPSLEKEFKMSLPASPSLDFQYIPLPLSPMMLYDRKEGIPLSFMPEIPLAKVPDEKKEYNSDQESDLRALSLFKPIKSSNHLCLFKDRLCEELSGLISGGLTKKGLKEIIGFEVNKIRQCNTKEELHAVLEKVRSELDLNESPLSQNLQLYGIKKETIEHIINGKFFKEDDRALIKIAR